MVWCVEDVMIHYNNDNNAYCSAVIAKNSETRGHNNAVQISTFLHTSNLYSYSHLEIQAIDDPSSNQFRDPPTYTHQPSMQQKVPFSLIRCSSSKVAFCSCVEWGWHIYNIVESESDPLTRRAVDLFEKEPLKGNSEVHLHTPTKFGEDRSKDLGGDREQTDRQTNRQTDKRYSIYSMIHLHL